MTRRAAAMVLCLLVAASAFGATIRLKDGRTVEGEILERGEKEIRVKLASGKVQTVKVSDVASIDEGPSSSNETGDAPVDAATKRYEKALGTPVTTVLTPLIALRGDHQAADLRRQAEVAERTARHFLQIFGGTPEEVLKGEERYGATRIEVFQFVKEDTYLTFCDKVLARIRDESVDDARLAFMRRQRGFWIVTPRFLMAQFMGPSDFTTCISAAVHKVSHEMLTLWKPSGTFRPWWLYEGLASWQEFAVLGETRTYCLELARPEDYARPGSPEADEAAKARLESGWKQKVRERVAARQEKELAVLGKMSLNELVLEDVQQSWSVVDWLHRQGGLRTFAVAYKDKRDLSAAFQVLLGVPSSSAHEEWRAWVLKTY